MNRLMFFRPKVIEEVIGGSVIEDDRNNADVTTIRLVRVKELQDGRRAWDVVVTYKGKPIHDGNDVPLLDPFESSQYSGCFKFFADDSFSPPTGRSKVDHERMLDAARLMIETYSVGLLDNLKLHDPAQGGKTRNILVIEDDSINSHDEKSLHNIVWELLENPEYWPIPKPCRIKITRIICATARMPGPKLIKGLQMRKPVRILLVIGRSLEQIDGQYTESINPGLVQHSIMQVMRHLEELGHQRRIQLDILRPATFKELKLYLAVGTEDSEIFDIIHLDMHGEMKAGKGPYFMFTKIASDSDSYVLGSDVATELRQRTQLLVMNACNSSSPTGELGIVMVRNFLNESMACVSAASYRIQESVAKIYYPVFYMSLLLNGSFDKAAAEARLALRKDQKRHKEAKRDDHYVHWNWSSTATIHNEFHPPRSLQLHYKMLLELIHALIYCIFGYVILLDSNTWERTKNHYPMFAMYRSFTNLESHISCAKQFDIPDIKLHIMEIEYWLKTKEKHSVYIYPHLQDQERLKYIRNSLGNMVRIWIQTNFVTEIRILQVEEMLKRLQPNYRIQNHHAHLTASADWCRRQSKQRDGRRELNIKSMLIIDGFEHLVPQKKECLSVLDEIEHERQKEACVSVLEEIAGVVKQMNDTSGDMYVITIGTIDERKWRQVDKLSRALIGQKWAGAKVMKINLHANIKPSTYSRRS